MNPPPSLAIATERAPATKYRFFPGYTMLGASAVIQYMSAPGQSYSVAAFKDPMRATLEISETSYSLAYGFATILSACLLPVVGRLIDRHGARVMLPLIAIGLGAACWSMAGVETLFGLYVSFCFIRSLGQGALSLVSVWLVGEWFERRRGMATAIAGIGGGLSIMTVPLLNNWLIDSYGWQHAWSVLAVAVWVTLIIPGILLIRDRPEDLGLHPDGTSAIRQAEETGDSTVQHTHEAWTVREVLANKTFWKLLAVPSTAGLVGTGLVFHQVALLGKHGISPTWALGLMAVQAGFATLLTFPVGYLTDRIPSRFILFTAMLVLAMANSIALTMPFLWLAVVYALLLGVHGSILRSTGNVIWINYFGRENQGAVRGVAWSAMILASALGPLPLAYCIDRTGSYNIALGFFMILPIASSIVVLSAKPPKRKVD